tara:strand:- start:1246 stop:1617 length:372 start_codon:yes stop_codon:yes gene_type:complete
MLSGYVKSSYLNIIDASKTTELTLVELNEGTNFRLLGIQFIPAEWGPRLRSGFILRSSLGGDAFFEDELYGGTFPGNAQTESFHSISVIPIPTHGVFASETSGVTVQGTGAGINFVSVTYQTG